MSEERGSGVTPPESDQPLPPNAASNDALGGSKSYRFSDASASGAPARRSMPAVLPLHRDGALVADGPQHAEDVLPGDVPVAGRDEVPAAARVAPGQVGAEAAVAAVQALAGLLAVHVVDPVPEVVQEADRVQVLPDEVARVEVQPEGGAVVHGLQCAVRGPVVVRDLAWVDLVGEADALSVEDVQDRVPALGEVLVAPLDHVRRDRREHRDQVPDRGAGEPDDGVHPERRGRPRGVGDLGGGPASHALRFAVAPDAGGQDALVAFVDGVVADGLSDQVVGDRPALQAVLVEELLAAVQVGGVRERLVDLEVIAPAGEFESVVTEVAGVPARPPPGGGLPTGR